MLLLAALLAVAPASAADLVVRLDRPVLVYVDGRLAPPDAGGLSVRVPNLGGGDHRIEIKNMLGAKVTALEVGIAADERVTLTYADKRLTETGREGAAPAKPQTEEERRAAELARREAELAQREAALAQQQAAMSQQQAATKQAATPPGSTTQAVSAQAGPLSMSVTVTEGSGGASVSVGGAAVGLSGGGSGGPGVSSASFVGLDPILFKLYLDGREVPWVAGWGAFVMPELPPGKHAFRMTLQGSDALTADFTTDPGRHSACTILVQPMSYDTSCADGGRAFLRSDLGGGATVGVTTSTAGFAAAPAAPAAPQPVSEADLQRLLKSVKDASFSSDQVDVLRTAAAHNHFTCAQVARLIAPISFGNDKVEAVGVLRPAIVDPERAYELESAFTFSSDKEAVRKLFR